MRLGFAIILVLLPGVAVAQPSQGVVTMLSGQATLTRRAPATPQPLRFKDDLFENDRINTREGSLVRALLRGKALVTVREMSVFTITEDARDQTVRLTWGKLALSVVPSRMRSGETIEIRTPNAIAAVRGTVVIVEVLPPTIPGATPNTRPCRPGLRRGGGPPWGPYAGRSREHLGRSRERTAILEPAR